jgi:hypothetical protein
MLILKRIGRGKKLAYLAGYPSIDYIVSLLTWPIYQIMPLARQAQS